MSAISCWKCFAFCLMAILAALHLGAESRKDHVVSFIYAFYSSEHSVCFQTIFLGLGLNLNLSGTGGIRLQKCFRCSWNVLLAHGNLLTNFLSLSPSSFTVNTGPIFPLKFLRALDMNLPFILYH